MGYGKQRGRKRSAKRSRKRVSKRKVYKRGIPAKALSGAVDTALEKRMRAIAKKEDAKNIVHLIDRKYLFGSCSKVTNAWRDGRRIFFDGEVDEIALIDKVDVNQVLNAPMAVDAEEAPLRQQLDGDGANQGMITKTIHGRRMTDLIKIDGFSVAMKVFQDRIPNEFQHDSAYAHNNSPNYAGQEAWHQWFLRGANGAYVRQLPETVVLKWALVQVTDETAKYSNDQVASTEYIAENFIPFRPFGYSRALDHDEADKQQFIKKKTLMRGECTLTLRGEVNKEKLIKRFVRFKNPIKVQYQPEDQNGDQALSKRFFFAVRTNLPIKREFNDAQGNPHTGHEDYQPLDYSPFAPKLMACVKTHYHE